MRANVGDRVIVGSHHVGVPARVGEIMEVRGDQGSPPYLVSWDDEAHTGLFFPGPDTTVEPHPVLGP